MKLTLSLADPKDAPELAELAASVAEDLTTRFGKGFWSSSGSEKGVLFTMKTGRVYVARKSGKIIATLRLATRKPWAIDRAYFTPCKRPIYLTGMAVIPDLQGQGIGRQCVEYARQLAEAWEGNAIYLDAYDAVAGAGEFYRKCGFQEVGRATYRTVPLIYYEMLLTEMGIHGHRKR